MTSFVNPIMISYCGSSMTMFVSPVSTTNTARSLAGSVSLAFALTRWWSPGCSTQFSRRDTPSQDRH
jgi:hypothetical protein